MDMSDLNSRGVVLLGCGKMGSAMLAGWLAQGLSPDSVYVIDPFASDWVRSQNVHVNAPLPDAPAVAVIAVKPQMMGDALPAMVALGGGGTVMLSVAAGVTLAQYEDVFGPSTPIVRAMPNTPCAIGQGISAMIGNAATGEGDLTMAEGLLAAVGQVVRLSREEDIDAVTGVSGSGPAYVFHLIEALAQAGRAQGLSDDVAMQLATATVAGAGALALQSNESPAQLRINVTSPGGTTQAGLGVLMDDRTGLPPLIDKTVAAAVARSKELARG